jgi:hypothetical protein
MRAALVVGSQATPANIRPLFELILRDRSNFNV